MKVSDINTTNVTALRLRQRLYGGPFLLESLNVYFYIFIALEIDKLSTKLEEEVYTRPIPLASCQEVRLGLDSGRYGPVLMADLFFSLAARSWKEYSERSFSSCPMEIRPPGFLAAWLKP